MAGDALLTTCWAALGGDPARLEDLAIAHRGRHLPSAFDVDGLAVGAVGAMLVAAAELGEARGAGRARPALDARHAAAAFTSERHARRDGVPTGAGFAPLSRFAPTADGWIRLHANYPHHRRALARALEVDEDDAEAALAAAAARRGTELEESVVALGGVAAVVRTRAAWAAHPQGRAAAAPPLVDRRPAPAGAAAPRGAATPPDRARPADGLRVLDLTRVIAGPVATRTLAALGADVLRIDPPHLPEDAAALLDTCPGKRLAALDLRVADGTLHALLAGADVLVHGYRPGALAAFGLDDATLAERHPHLVVVALGAWGHDGPWARRRGFDSIVQAACGIADAEGRDGTPGALPAQALDHATGYLMAGAVLRAAADRAAGRPWCNARLALAVTAAALTARPAARADDAGGAPWDPDAFRVTVAGEDGPASLIGPPGTLDGAPLGWDHGPRRGAAAWR